MNKRSGKYDFFFKFSGLIKSLQYEHSIDAATQNFAFICAAFSSFKDPPADLEQNFG